MDERLVSIRPSQSAAADLYPSLWDEPLRSFVCEAHSEISQVNNVDFDVAAVCDGSVNTFFMMFCNNAVDQRKTEIIFVV